jgi:hypothetical protein
MTTKVLSVGASERDVANQITKADAEILVLRRRLNVAVHDRDAADEIHIRLTSLRKRREELCGAIAEARQRDAAAESERRLDMARRQYYSFNVLWLRECRAVVLRLESLLADAKRKEQQFLDQRSHIHSTLRQELLQAGVELELPSGDPNDGASDPAGDAKRFQRLIAEIDQKWAARDDQIAGSQSVKV